MRVCPACSQPAVEFIPEASGDVCTDCGYTVDVVLLDGSKDIADGHGLSLWRDGMATVLQPIGRRPGAGTGGWLAQDKDKANLRLLREQDHLRDMQRYMRGMLAHLNCTRYIDRAFGLFDVVRRASVERTNRIRAFWKEHEARMAHSSHADARAGDTDNSRGSRRVAPKLFNWGLKARALALACVYATIATAEPDSLISLQQVINASAEDTAGTGAGPSSADRNALSYRKVVKRLRLVREFGGEGFARIREDAPRFYLHAALDFFEHLSEALHGASSASTSASCKGKERVSDAAHARLSHDPSLGSLSGELADFLAHVRFPRARTLAVQLARTLEEANYPALPGPTRSIDQGQPTARESSMHMDLTAYAIVMWAMEASGRLAGPQMELISLSECARLGGTGGLELLRKRVTMKQVRPSAVADGSLTSSDEDVEDRPSATSSKSTLQLRYSDIRKILNDSAKHIPWVLSASILASGRRRNQPPKKATSKGKGSAAAVVDVDSALDMSRLDIIRWLSDILAFRIAASRRKESYDHRKIVTTSHASKTTVDGMDTASEVVAAQLGACPPTPPPFDLTTIQRKDSHAVSRLRQRLTARNHAEEGIEDLDAALDTALAEARDETERDAILFDSDEDPDELYLRSEAERAVREAVMREDGVWDLDEARMRREEEKERERAERAERRKSKVLFNVGAANGSGKGKRKRVGRKGASASSKRQRRAAQRENGAASGRVQSEFSGKEEEEEEEEEEEDNDDEDAENASGRSTHVLDADWARPLDLTLQTEGWSDSSDEGEDESEEEDEDEDEEYDSET
ncbi:hypothetical protein OC842_004032 [Tilletia horrida]|uniref:Uncharacterized protein n=1 Tax=Tilletia horrida TaxID=155126 RepID=A0AAN6GAK6_9BASI|nr:hypothetical protein OC842_004032 [Tilletia horrida]